MTRKVGLFGGSFDPIHSGHIEPVRQARRLLALERVIYLPTARPPHKSERFAPAEARYTMVELALLNDEDLVVSPFEMRDEPCYTVDTVEHFRRELPDAELVLLIGGDSWAAFPRWYAWQRIVENAQLAVMLRPGASEGRLLPELEAARAKGRLHFVRNEPCPVSSTELRALLARGAQPGPDTMPRLVLDYVRKYRLYKTD